MVKIGVARHNALPQIPLPSASHSSLLESSAHHLDRSLVGGSGSTRSLKEAEPDLHTLLCLSHSRNGGSRFKTMSHGSAYYI